MSTTQDISFIRSLCLGEINEDIIFPYPKMKESERETVRSIADSLKSWLSNREEDYRKWDEAGELPPKMLQEIREFGLFSLIIPEEYGGMGLSTSAYSRVIQELVTYDGSVAITAGAHSSIGMKGLVMFGTDEQKKRYLPKLASGEIIAAYCLTEAGSGSDAASIKTRAYLDGDHWVLNGEKIWITNGGIADFFTVFAATDTPDGKMTAFIVTRDMAGVSTGPHENKMGIRASSTTTVILENVKVPKSNVLGEVGKGFKVAVKILNNGRTGLGGGSVGAMKKCIQLATKQAKERKQFGKSISEFTLIKKKLGQMMIDCYVAESVVNMVSGMIDAGQEDYAVEAAISKVLSTEMLWRTCDEALQIAGGNGFMREYPYERIMRDVRINRIFEGTNEILHLFIALTAMSDAGKRLKDMSDINATLAAPIKGFGLFADYAKMRVASATGIGKAVFTKVHPDLKSYAMIFESNVRTLTGSVDRILRKHGKNIVNKQIATKRLATIMIDLFTMACVLSRVTQSIEENGKEKAQKEIDILDAFTQQTSERLSAVFIEIDNNTDETLKDLSDFAIQNERYVWDNI